MSVVILGIYVTDLAFRAQRMPLLGETVAGSAFAMGPGGKGSNQAVACGKAAFISTTEQDVTVDMIGAVGKGDPY